MGVDVIMIGVQIRRLLVITLRICYRKICRHPFLVGMVCFFIFLYRSFPFLFSLLVSASPVLVCTAVLLGTLLSFGEPNIPEIEKEIEREEEKEEEEVTHEILSLKSRVVEGATIVVGEDEGICVDRFTRERNDIAERAVEELGLEENKINKIEEVGDLGDCVPLIDENSRHIHFEKKVIEETEKGFDDLEERRKIQEEFLGIKEVLSHKEVIRNQYSLVRNVEDDNLEGSDDESPGDFIVAQNGNHLDFSQDSSWEQANDDDDGEASDSGSDGVESSSPDASMADILPMLDELHPLLEEETPRPVSMSREGSDTGSERSLGSKESDVDSDDDIEKHPDEDGDDNDNDNEEEEEDAQRDKDDENKSAIKWTEDDQKNLMDLGTSEIERNQRLESLIARRRARRNLRLMAEKNLIDLDGIDFPTNIPPISTARRNPFDLSYDSYDDVPGSAPSVLQPRRNPFDLPYDSSEEKPDLKGDSFHQEFSAFQRREPFFRRHESFSIGPSVLGGPRQDRQDLRWKPYFVPERFTTEGTSYHAFQRQLSEASESKVSSVPDTESVSSAVDEDDKKINEEDVFQETELISNLDHASLLVERGSLSEDIDSTDIEKVEERDVHHDEDEITLGDVENHHEIDLNLSELEGTAPVELNTREILLRMGAVEEEYSSSSSLSSLSEIDEKIPDVHRESASLDLSNAQIEESHISTHNLLDSDFQFMSSMRDAYQEKKPYLKPKAIHVLESVALTQMSDVHFASGAMDHNQHGESVSKPPSSNIGDSGISKQSLPESDSVLMDAIANDNQRNVTILEPSGNSIEGSGISTQTRLESDFHFTSGVVDLIQYKDPVYDLSPSSIYKFSSLSSTCTQGETLEMGSPPALIELAHKESEAQTDEEQKDTSGDKEMHESSSSLACSLDENESKPREVTDVSERDVIATKVEVSGFDPKFDSQNGSMKSESVVEHVFVDLPQSETEDDAFNKEISRDEQDKMLSLALNGDKTLETQSHVIEKLDSASSGSQMASEFDARDSPVVTKTALEAKPVEEHAMGMEETLHLEQDKICSSSLNAHISGSGSQARSEKLDLAVSCSDQMPCVNLAHTEREPTVVEEQVPEPHLDISSLDAKYVEEKLLRKEETVPFEQDQVLSSTADDRTIRDLCQDEDVKVVTSGSSYQQMASEDSSLFELEKWQSWSDKTLVETILEKHDEPSEPFKTPTGSGEVCDANNTGVPEAYNPEDNMSRNVNSLNHKSTSVPPESPEYKSSTGEMDLKENILDKIVYEDSGHLIDRFNYSTEAYGSPVTDSNVIEEEDEIKEIDEELLSELDTVGDFGIKEVGGESFISEQISEKSIRNPEFDPLSNDQTEFNPELLALEVRSIEDIDLAFKQIYQGVDVKDVVLPSMNEDQVHETKGNSERNSDVVKGRSLEDADISMKQVSEGNIVELAEPSQSKDGWEEENETVNPELPALEVRSVEDIDLAFKQIYQGVDVKDIVLPSMNEDQVHETKGNSERNSDVAEARSLEDTDISMKQVSEGNIVELAEPSQSKDRPEEENETNSIEELPALEVRSVEDIDLAFKQIYRGVDVKDVVLPSMDEDQVHETKGNSERNSDVAEARSLEDTDISMKQVPEGNIVELAELSQSKDGPGEENETDSIEELPVLEVRTTRDIDLAFKQLLEGVDVDEVIVPSTIEQRQIVDDTLNTGPTSADLPIVEAKSLEDIHVAMEQVLQGNTAEQPKLMDSENGSGQENEGSSLVVESRTSEVNEVVSSKDIESSTINMIETSSVMKGGSTTPETSAQETSTISAHKPKD